MVSMIDDLEREVVQNVDLMMSLFVNKRTLCLGAIIIADGAEHGSAMMKAQPAVLLQVMTARILCKSPYRSTGSLMFSTLPNAPALGSFWALKYS